MRRSITSVLLIGLLLSTHTILAICGLHCTSQFRGCEHAITTATKGMQGMAHCHASSQLAGQGHIESGCCHSNLGNEEFAWVADPQYRPHSQAVGSVLTLLLNVTDESVAVANATSIRNPRSLPHTSSSLESILNLRV